MRKFLIGVAAGVAALVAVPFAAADGTETLGPPSISIAPGTGVVAAGVGTHGTGAANVPKSFSVNVPTGAAVKQVLLYWTGHATLFADQHCPGSLDNTISVNGNSVTGTLIGGPTNFFQAEYFATYRHDVTSLNLVSAGANALTITNMHFQSCFPYTTGPDGNDGAGVMVIYDDGTDSAIVGVRDGQDLAFANFLAPLNTTEPQTLTFSPAPSARPANLATLASSVSGPDLAGLRGNVLRLTFDVGGSLDIVNGWQSVNGAEFDALNSSITIPANATSLTVQALSQGGVSPASFSWIGATLAIQNQPRPGADGCTPGLWKNHDGSKNQANAWTATGYSPSQLLSSVFSSTGLGSLGSSTLKQALDFKGGSTLEGKKQILLRAAVAALLNAAHPDVSYPLSTAQVIAQVNAALEGNDATTIIDLASDLDTKNNAGCTVRK